MIQLEIIQIIKINSTRVKGGESFVEAETDPIYFSTAGYTMSQSSWM